MNKHNFMGWTALQAIQLDSTHLLVIYLWLHGVGRAAWLRAGGLARGSASLELRTCGVSGRNWRLSELDCGTTTCRVAFWVTITGTPRWTGAGYRLSLRHTATAWKIKDRKMIMISIIIIQSEVMLTEIPTNLSLAWIVSFYLCLWLYLNYIISKLVRG